MQFSAQPACGDICVGTQPQVLQCTTLLMGLMGCPAAADGKARLHRCLARVVSYSIPENGGLTSTPAQLGRAPGEGLDQCLLLNRVPSLRSMLSKFRSCMKSPGLARPVSAASMPRICSHSG